MMKLIKSSTLRLSVPFGQTAFMTFFILVGLWALGEYILRQPAVTRHLPAPSYGSEYRFIDLKFTALEHLVEEQGPIDCVFVGSSAVDRAVDIAVFEDTYRAVTGEPIQCFNFGLAAGRDSAGLVLIKLLIEDYHPRLIVFGIAPRTLSNPVEIPVQDIPWIAYRLGNYSFKGWLVEHSALYRYSLGLGRWIVADKEGQFEDWKRLLGLQGQIRIGGQITFPLSADVRKIIEDTNHALLPNGIERLQTMMSFHQPPNQMVVIVEIPLHPVMLEGYPDKQQDYQDTITQIEQYTSEKGILFWPTMLDPLVTEDSSWNDHAHMSRTGAQIFSQWMGEQIGEAVNQGQLADPTAPLLQLP